MRGSMRAVVERATAAIVRPIRRDRRTSVDQALCGTRSTDGARSAGSPARSARASPPRRARRAGARAPGGRRARRTGGAVSGTPGASRPRISSSSPRSNCWSTRRATRSDDLRRREPQGDGQRPRIPAIGDAVSAKCAVSGRPVRKNTSSARTMRLQVARLDARADCGIDARAACGAGTPTPRRSAIASSRARSARVAAGPGNSPRVSARIVEAGAADEDRQAPARVDVADRVGRVARELRRRVLVGRIGDVDQVMRDAAPVGRRHLVGADVEAAIDGGRIAVDDLAAEALGKRERRARSCRSRSGRGSRRQAGFTHT